VIAVARIAGLFLAMTVADTALIAADCEGLPGVHCSADGRMQYVTPVPKLKPVETLGGAFATNTEPATWGAITFNGDGSRCIGLLRRGTCK
jgi:hypothetical protein